MARIAHMLGFLLLVAAANVAGAADSVSRTRAGEFQHIAADSYVAVARRALEETHSGRRVSLLIEPTGSYRDLRVPAGSLELRARVASRTSRSHSLVWVDVFVDGRLQASRPVGFTVHSWDRVLVAKERLAAKTVLDEQQFELRRTDVAGLEDIAVKDVNVLAGKRLRRELRAGAALSIEDLQDVPIVQGGDRISVYARVGRVVVRTAAVALRDGFAGDVIDARVTGSGESLRVRVTGNNTAWISENETTSVF